MPNTSRPEEITRGQFFYLRRLCDEHEAQARKHGVESSRDLASLSRRDAMRLIQLLEKI